MNLRRHGRAARPFALIVVVATALPGCGTTPPVAADRCRMPSAALARGTITSGTEAVASPGVIQASTDGEGRQFRPDARFQWSQGAAMSADGAAVAFTSTLPRAAAMGPLLVKDLGTGGLSAVRVPAGALKVRLASADPTRVAYSMAGCGLAEGDVDGTDHDVYVRDLTTGIDYRVTTPGDSGPVGMSETLTAPYLESMSGDGTVVATGRSWDLGPGVFGSEAAVTDLATRRRIPIDVPGYSDPFGLHVSADGTTVAFAAQSDTDNDSQEDDYITDDRDQQAFALDLRTGQVRMVSTTRQGQLSNRAGFAAVSEPNIDSGTYFPEFDTVLTDVVGISGDGRTVFFTSNAVNLGRPTRPYVATRHLYRKDLTTGKVTRLARHVLRVAVSRDGEVVAFVRRGPMPAPDAPPLARAVASHTGAALVVKHLRSGRTVVLSRAASAFRDAISLSADGRRVAFTTGEALVSQDTNNVRDVYVRTFDW